MTEEFVPYDRALKLRQLGFDGKGFIFIYWMNSRDYITKERYLPTIWSESGSSSRNIKYDWDVKTFMDDFKDVLFIELQIPTFSQAFRWFREKYDIYYSIDRECSQQDHKWGYNWSLYNYTSIFNEYLTSHPDAPAGEWVYETYEEAELACLDKLIEIVELSKRDEKICTCVDGVITCPGCDGEKESEFGVCAGCNGNGEVTCGKCGGKS